MTSLIVGCSGAYKIGKKIAEKLRKPYSRLNIEKFPDNELHIGFNVSLKGKKVFLVQSFFKDISDKILETLFAAQTAKELGAKKIVLIAPYFPYLRQDKKFREGEGISAKIIAQLFSSFDKIFIVEPHLHRFKKFEEFFPNATKISVATAIKEYIAKNFKDYIIIGPDQESANWILPISELLSIKPIIFEKKRISPKKVKLISKLNKKKMKKLNLAIIIDDIISTGDTMIKAGKESKKIANKIFYIGIHGIFVENAMKKLEKIGKVVSTNSIPSSTAKIDISGVIAKKIKKWIK